VWGYYQQIEHLVLALGLEAREDVQDDALSPLVEGAQLLEQVEGEGAVEGHAALVGQDFVQGSDTVCC